MGDEMGGMDTKTMIHIATEVLLIGGLGFWTKNKVDTLGAQVEDLTKKLAVYENVIQQQQGMLAKHEAFMQQLFEIPQIQALLRANYGAAPRPVQTLPPQQPLAEANKPPVNNGAAPLLPVRQPPSAQQNQTPPKPQEEEKDIPVEDLDKILQEELSQGIEIDTAEPLPPGPLKQKRKGSAGRKKKITSSTNVESQRTER